VGEEVAAPEAADPPPRLSGRLAATVTTWTTHPPCGGSGTEWVGVAPHPPWVGIHTTTTIENEILTCFPHRGASPTADHAMIHMSVTHRHVIESVSVPHVISTAPRETATHHLLPMTATLTITLPHVVE
jgi:hypothetical protein